ncbi:MAG: hypothetical protein JJU29_07520 [Verrucomicrobia bacterium]|nr:hypothetical protein [Verrucomicrobiota bacterium]MCH8511649.1 hypothetical protein [Kiritimatiellia bacterium]
MKGALLGDGFLNGVDALVEVLAQSFVLKHYNKKGEAWFPRETNGNPEGDDLFKAYATLLALTHALVEPRNKGFAVDRVFQLAKASETEQNEKPISVAVGKEELIRFKNKHPFYLVEVCKHVWHSSEFKQLPLEHFYLRHSRFSSDHNESKYELLEEIDQLSLNRRPDTSLPEHMKAERLLELSLVEMKQDFWSHYRLKKNFEWSPPVGNLDARSFLRVLFLNRWHGLVLRAELSQKELDPDFIRFVKLEATRAGLNLREELTHKNIKLQANYDPSPLELFDHLSCEKYGQARNNILQAFLGQANVLVSALESQRLVEKGSLFENDVHDVLRRLRKIEAKRLNQQAEIRISLNHIQSRNSFCVR